MENSTSRAPRLSSRRPARSFCGRVAGICSFLLLCFASSTLGSPALRTSGGVNEVAAVGGDFCVNGLRAAINAAILELAGEHYVGSTLLPQFPDVPYVPILVCPAPTARDSLPPVVNPPHPKTTVVNDQGVPIKDAQQTRAPPTAEALARDRASLWPELSALHESDLLFDVLKSGVLKVAGLGPRGPDLRTNPDFEGLVADPELAASQAEHGFNWGQEGNYSVDPPVGYFPTYLRAIVEKVSMRYRKPVRSQYIFFSNGGDAMKSVARGVAHMTDIYFILAFQQGSMSHLDEFYHTCPVSASPNNLLTLKEYRIRSLQDLVRTLRMASDPAMRTLAYLSTGNYETVHFFFPRHTLGEVMAKEEAERRIAAREILGNIRTGTSGQVPDTFEMVDLGLVLAQGPWLKRTDTAHCVYHQLVFHQGAKKAYAPPSEEADAETINVEASTASGLRSQAGAIFAASLLASLAVV
ncbi:conserved hypothetical protein [Neospora caninum Liverpool]|uniref:Uncharacterized protein n=1 Tax=Neospora caninum (strain Liverpool) TaxID=572307 RepID=F0VGH7_NEOCL|nr:conserved hypothetical protein [Neospora caninum Liverpool]CBZ52821.1 conserved hypothetical protein [Neospora caninum Liverpool]CEL66801.1 TPA: hypothetical protein BN1204_026100 [Neospora caninum Liverpool]|eukprot:XP_003882853.1 conserved hypothetical protein [Neospora caninum Liverpool]